MDFNWLRSFFGRKQQTLIPQTRSLENPAVPLTAMWYGPPSLAGVRIDEHTAESIAAFWCGVRTISVDLASLKIRPFDHQINGGSKPAKNHWSYPLVFNTPNGTLPAIRFWATIIQHAITWGNGTAFIDWAKSGRGLAFHLILPNEMQIEVHNHRLLYQYYGSNRLIPKKMEPWQVLHIANPMSFDGYVGTGVVTAARESLGLALAGEISMAAFYGNSAKPGGYYQYPEAMPEQAVKNAREYIDSVHTGPLNNGRAGHLYGGICWNPNTLPPPDEAYLKSREFQIQELSRWLCCPPTILNDYSRATWSNIEQASLDYQNRTLRPWAEFICAECDLKLLSNEERKSMFFKADYHELLKADKASRSAYYASALQWGYLSKNEVRAMEDRASMGPEGDVFTSPSNMITGQQVLQQQTQPPPEPTQEKGPTESPPTINPAKASIASRFVVVEEIKRLLRREAATIKRAATKADFKGFIADHQDEFAATIRSQLEPSLTAFNVVSGSALSIDSIAHQWCDETANQLAGIEEVTTSDQLPQAIDDLLKTWEGRAETILAVDG